MHVYWASVFILPSQIILDIEQLMRGFLWCHGDMSKGKAKVSWEVVYLPKNEGGLGVRRLDTFNKALMVPHIWNLLARKDTLWVKWIHVYKLRGRHFFDIPYRGCMTWGWRKLLQLRPLIRDYLWFRIGTEWLSKYPSLISVAAPMLSNEVDQLEWHNSMGVVKHFSVREVWETIRPRSDVVDCLPTCCPLCDGPSDSHDHLFFDCAYSSQIWNEVKSLAGLPNVVGSIVSIVNSLIPIAKRRTIRSVIAKLLVAATSYYIWQERNSRLFANKKRSHGQLTECIKSTVRLKLLSCDDANKHIDKFLTVTQSMKQNGVSHDVLRLCLFPYSLTHHATSWFDRLPKNSIHSWEEMAQYRGGIRDLFAGKRGGGAPKIAPRGRAFLGFKKENFTINVAAGGTFVKRRPEECYDLIKNMTAHHNDWDTSAQRGESSRSITSSSPEIAALTQQIAEMNKNFLRMSQSNQQVNIVNPSCETCGGPHHYSECQAAGGFTQGDVYAATGNYNTGVITTRSGITLAGPSVPSPNPPSSKEVEQDPETTMDQVHISSSESTARVPYLVIQPALASKSNEIPERNPHQPPIHYPSSFVEVLAQMPKYAKMLKDLLNNKEKLLEFANTHLNENCSAFLLNKLPEKLEDPRKFLIPCYFKKLKVCMSLAYLGARINLMPLSVYQKLNLGELKPTRMSLELANRSVTYPVGIAEDVFMQVDKFAFPADFVVIDYDVDPRVPLILVRPILRTARALVDHGNESIKQNDIIDTTCEDHFHEELNVQKSFHPLSGSPTPYSDPVVASLSPSLTSFEDSNSLLDEIDAFLALDSIPPDIDNGIFDAEGDILLLEKLLNIDSTKDLPPQELNNDSEGDVFFLENLLKDEHSEAKNSEIDSLIGGPFDTFLMGDTEIKFNPLKDIDDHVSIPRVSEKPPGFS
ncbi:reverse transcriptase domain-containing protein [Tanacetum coccineum]